MPAIEALGWTPDRARELRDRGLVGAAPARVSAVHRATVEVMCSEGPLTLDTPRGEPLAVGDWVAIEGDPARVRARLERGTCLIRQAAGRATEPQILAANVDLAFLVTALGGDMAPRRLERFQTLCHAGGVRPVVVLNKIDLDFANIGRHIGQAEAAAPGVPVVTTTTMWSGGIDELLPYLCAGRTVVMLGSSGVGKSSLLNVIMGGEAAPTRQLLRDPTARKRAGRRMARMIKEVEAERRRRGR